ncbi:hypothetical protein EFL98_00325 [Lactococcus lactis]|uniref:hypothetical protein n=1 Tax=Lactococcus lactis TaxID=1358 RepID=UPI00223AEBF3|nr:hypothetical protein [Lactococcus lactis]MCT1191004.1 hypothetical protein [Lactococcus lactis]
METDTWNNFWTAIVGFSSLLTSIIAIRIANRANKQVENQIEINNKQFLFKNRFEILKSCHTLIYSFAHYQIEIDKDKKENETKYGSLLLENNKLAKLTDNEVIGIKNDMLNSIEEKNTNKRLEKTFRIPENLSAELSFVYENDKIGLLQIFLCNYTHFLLQVSFYKTNTSLKNIDKIENQDYKKLYESWEKVQEAGIITLLEKDTKIFYKI